MTKLAASAVLLAAVMSAPSIGQAEASAQAAASDIEKVISTGFEYMGTPYQFGSDRDNTSTFDCSDFVRHIFKKAAGVTLPSVSAEQAQYVKTHSGATESWRQLKRGDLMFFMSYHGSDKSDYTRFDKTRQEVTHVAIYLGDGKMLHTYSKESGGVRTDSIEGTTWEYRFLFGGAI